MSFENAAITPPNTGLLIQLLFLSQDRIQQRQIAQQEQLLERYEAKMTLYENQLRENSDQIKQLENLYENKINGYSNRIEELESQLNAALTKRESETDDVSVPINTRTSANMTVNSKVMPNANDKAAIRSSSEIMSVIASHKRPRLVLDNEAGPIAFHATHDVYYTYHIGRGQHILFEDVHLNEGNGFHEQHGLFIAPRSGLYLFSVSIMSLNDGSDIIAAIEKDGTTLAKTYAGGSASKFDQGSVSIVTRLAVGSEVWISSIERDAASEYGGMFISFMGYLLDD